MHNLLCLLSFQISIQFRKNPLDVIILENEPVISRRVMKSVGKDCNVFQDPEVFLRGVCRLPGTECPEGQFLGTLVL